MTHENYRQDNTQKRERGLYGKFRIERTDGRDQPGEKHDGCRYFVLDLDHDPLAVPAIWAYANSARDEGYDALADDLEALVSASAGRYGTLDDAAPDREADHG